VFSKSCANSSLRTQCAAAASANAHCPTVFHRRNRRARKKRRKQDLSLREMVVPLNQFKFSIAEIDSKVIVVDGGCEMSPPIRPPHGIRWCPIPVRDLHIEDELSGDIGLSFPRINGTSPFIRLPRQVSLEIISHVGLPAIYDALSQCEKLRRVALCRSDGKRVFTDYGKQVTYACVGPQPSRNSNVVLDNPPFLDALPQRQWEHLVWLMKRAEIAFKIFADHCVISHLHHAKKLVHFKTFSPTVDKKSSTLSSDFFGGIAFGSNVFLRCHTDADFTMSITQVFLKGCPEYQLKDRIIAYFCFPTLGVAVPLRPGDYFMFNALIPHCISSRCNMEDEIMCTSVYLKTAVVGMHNNALELTEKQSQIANKLYPSNNK
jgi:hypothetical protein